MQELNIALLELAKISICTSNKDFDFAALSNDEWNNVFIESKKQTMALMCFDAFKEINVKPNDEIYNRWFIYCAGNIKNNVTVVEEQKRLIALLNENSIPYVILKGTSSSSYYPNSKIRCLGDIDFIVDESLLYKVKTLLINNDYKMEDDINPIHFEFYKGKIRLELHKKISGIPDNKYGAVFTEELRSLMNESVLDDEFVRPSDYHHGIIIFLHTLHHILNNGIGIRHLCDWACFVNKTQDEAFWEERFIPLLKKTGTYNFMCGVTLAAVELLNINKPKWCSVAANDMVNTIVHEITYSGNFGTKKSKRYSLVMTRMDSGKSSVFSKIRGMLRALNKTNHIVCPLIKKLPIIYPFLMIYRIARYLILMFLGKKPSLRETSKYADERSLVYSKYKLYKVEDEEK